MEATQQALRFGPVSKEEAAELVRENLRLLAEMLEDYRTDKPEPLSASLLQPEDGYRILAPEMESLEQEEMRVLLLDNKQKLIAAPMIYRGCVNAIQVRISEVFREAVRQNAVSIMVAHNHPSGDPTPSPQDVKITKDLIEAGKILDIHVLDHLVIGRGRFVSLKREKYV